MSWLDELRSASFRGVEFYVHEAEMKGGRTIVTHEVPGSERRPFREDLGSAGRSHAVTAYLYGDDYRDQLRELLDALDTSGPGELNHPFIGVALCVVDGEYSVRQSGDEGGLAAVTITFAETVPAMPAPAAVASNTTAVLAGVVEAARASAAASFAAEVQGLLEDGIAGVAFAGASSLLAGVGEQMRAALSRATVPGELLASFGRLLSVPTIHPEDFIATPAAFFPAQVGSLFDAVTAALLDAASLVPQPVAQLLALYDAVTVPDGADEATEAIAPAVSLLVQRGALTAAAAALPALEFATYDDAVLARQTVIDAINSHTATSADDTYADFVDLRGAVARAVPGADSGLPRLQQYTAPAGVPSLVLAHRLYGDVADEADLLARNGIANPCFVPGGWPLEVLSRG